MNKYNIQSIPQQKIPINQISGIEPNYSFDSKQNLNFDSSSISQSGFSNVNDLQKAVNQQQQFVNNYNSYQPNSTFRRQDVSNNSNLENLRDFSQFNIKENFQVNTPIEKMLDTKYLNNTLYNNLNENLLKESIREYRLNIDSINRDPLIYPDPFSYVINLGPVVNSGINTPVSKYNLKSELANDFKNVGKNKKKQIINNVDRNIVSNESLDEYIFKNPDLIKDYTINLENINNPYIVRDFKNVKYITLDTAVVPRFNTLRINYDWDFCREKNHKKNFIKDDYDRLKDLITLNFRYIPDEININSPLGDRFVQIYIKELTSTENFGTNAISDKSFILIFDKILGIFYFKCIPYSAKKTYKESLLGNLTRLTIQFYDSWGNKLTLNTDQINYEKNQILNTNLFDPTKYSIMSILENEIDKNIYIEKMTNIIKCFVIINYDIKHKIPFYNSNNFQEIELEEDKFCLNANCEKFLDILINESQFTVPNIYLELNEFVTKNGFIDIPKKTKKGKCITLSIDQYIDNVIWFNKLPTNNEFIDNNIKSFDFNYRSFGYNILDKLKLEIVNIPVNKIFQNYLTFLLGIYTNELNTKVDYYV